MLFIFSVPDSVFVITVPPVFSIFPYVFESSSPFPLSVIVNEPLLFNNVLFPLVKIYPFKSIVIFFSSDTSNVGVLEIMVAFLNISIVSPLVDASIASCKSVYSIFVLTNFAIGNLSRYLTS